MYISRRTIISWNSKWLRPRMFWQLASSYQSPVLDASDRHSFTENARCKLNYASHPYEGHRVMPLGLIEHALFTEKQCLAKRSSHTHLATSACSLYAKTSVLKSPTFIRRLLNNIRMYSTETGASKLQCWSCGRSKSEKGFLICPSCNAVQAPDPDISYFEIFDQDQKFELNLKDLESKYKSLMKTLHPDLTHGKSREEKEHYAQWSARVTTAYTELLKPVSRATYLLKLRGIRVEEEGTVTDTDLIMEVMDIRETLQSRPNRQTLEQLNKIAMARMDEWSQAFKSALEEGKDEAAVGALQRMSYFGRVCEDINRELL